MIRLRWLAPAGLLVLSLLAAGCDDPIRTYEVPYQKQRMLAAIIRPSESATWFVKLMGPADDVAAQKETFDAFLQSLEFPDGGRERATWTLPEGWTHEPGKGMRYATFYLPGKLQVTLTRFEGEGGSISANVNRWRGQMNLEPIREANAGDILKPLTLKGDVQAFVLDMESQRYLPAMDFERMAKRSKSPIDYELPAGWAEKSTPAAFAVASFTIEDQGKRADVTISAVGGSLSMNLNRWRGQVGLPDVSEKQLLDDAKPMTIDRQPSLIVEYHGQAGSSILGAVRPGEDRSWFIKMTGDTELVKRQRETFEKFLGTLRFPGGK